MSINVTKRKLVLQKGIFISNLVFLKDADQQNFDLDETLWENEDT